MTQPQAPRPVERFMVDDEWTSALPFEKIPRGIVHFPLECVVYVPSTRGDDPITPEEFRARREETAALLVSLFGGCRESMSVGRYRSRDGDIVAEEVAVITGFGNAEDFGDKRRQFLEWLIDKRTEWEQEALGFEFEGDLWYL